jgi:AbiV family abortive infection protein
MTRSDGTPADITRTEGSPPEAGVREPTQQAVTATLSHADDLLKAAGRLMPDLPHLAFHFAALALEEVGRATLLVMLEAAGATTNSGLEGAQEDHVAKLFWALWGPSFGRAAISRAQIDEHRNLARYVHERRKAGLYFNPEGPPPRAAITVDETETLIEMAVARVGMERSHVYGPLDDARAADVRWFVERTRDGQRRYEIFGAASMDKLVQLGNVT